MEPPRAASDDTARRSGERRKHRAWQRACIDTRRLALRRCPVHVEARGFTANSARRAGSGCNYPRLEIVELEREGDAATMLLLHREPESRFNLADSVFPQSSRSGRCLQSRDLQSDWCGPKGAAMILSKEKQTEDLEYIKQPEIIIGLVGPVGLAWGTVIDIITQEFSRVHYSAAPIHLSRILEEIFGTRERRDEGEYERLIRLMTQGDRLRQALKHPDALALLSVAAIQRARQSINFGRRSNKDLVLNDLTIDTDDLANVPLHGYVYILRSLKTPAEVRLLRKVYGRAFFVISAYSSHEARIARLSRRIGSSVGDADLSKHRDVAEKLNERDEKDRESPGGNRWGQNVSDTFPEGDLFINADNPRDLRSTIRRFVEALFGYQFHTPTKDEYGMFLATAACRRSADLSRQVGAVVTTREGQIVAVGCNEVPKAGGGLYWTGDPGDVRDFRLGKDINHELKDLVMREAISRLRSRVRDIGVGLGGEQSELAAEIESIFRKLEDQRHDVLRGARITGLLEFGRTVHAEMAAIADAALRGVSVKGTTMYVTTFPCHLCARHIAAAGIERLVYIEPYPKSMVRELYPDSIAIDASEESKLVRFEPYFGLSPGIYLEFCEIPEEPKRESRSTGEVIAWTKDTMCCRIRRYVASYIFIELRVVSYLAKLLQEKRDELKRIRKTEPSDGEFVNTPKWQSLQDGPPQHCDTNILDWLSKRKQGVEQLSPGWLKLVMDVHRH
jgi:deoxycytidylate deaminase